MSMAGTLRVSTEHSTSGGRVVNSGGRARGLRSIVAKWLHLQKSVSYSAMESPRRPIIQRSASLWISQCPRCGLRGGVCRVFNRRTCKFWFV